MKKFVLLVSTIVICITTQSCSQKKENSNKYLQDYNTIIFESKRKKICVSDDFSSLEEWIKEKNGEYKQVQKKLNFSKNERDSLAKYAYRIINQPTLATKVLTCGAGENITIEISYGSTSISCKYSSIESWSSLSNDNKKLYEILNAKTAIPK
ncbi:hypothetical protein [Flavobacterium pectinovorum]|uniref:Uncharacterized protein n=1 Tax=Flavobacterium pectinovorum TaxID=29533 RepID=A0A502F010_9FLAO|nr:hypothetical protein [Flavobacterium pectinovorum]TPG41771.1 hypothetical protein EAH81_09855 [Flavobacterium pectinovorum]